MPVELLWHGLEWWFVFLVSTSCHEAAHAWTAYRGGDPTAYLGGQLSLDPLPHIRREPVGMVVVPWLTFLAAAGGWMMGWASAPLNPYWVIRYPRRAAWVALAGPLANLTLVVAAVLLIRFGLLVGLLELPTSDQLEQGVAGLVVPATVYGTTFAHLLAIFFQLNLLLFLFNLLPLPPLDGAGALPLLFGDAAAGLYRAAVQQPMLSLVGLMIAWRVFPDLYWPVHHLAVAWLYPELFA